MLWTIKDSIHEIPTTGAKTSAAAEDVWLDDGTNNNVMAARVATGSSYWCPIGSEFLASDGYQPCVPVFGVSAKRSYLAHVEHFYGDQNFPDWDDDPVVMILRKPDAAHRDKVRRIYEYCCREFTHVMIEDLPWEGSTGVVAFRSTCIAYLEASQKTSYAKMLAASAAADAAGGKAGDTKGGDTKGGSGSAAAASTATAAAGAGFSAADAQTFFMSSAAKVLAERMEEDRLQMDKDRANAAAAMAASGAAAGGGASAAGNGSGAVMSSTIDSPSPLNKKQGK